MSGRRQAIETAVVEILRYLPIIGPIAVFAASFSFAGSTVGGPAHWTRPLDSYLPAIAASGVLLFPFGSYFIMDGVYRLAQAWTARSWTQATGEILSSEVAPVGIFRNFHTPMVSFRYVAGDFTYEGDDIQTARSAYLSESTAADVAARDPVGNKVPVHYDPQEPEFAVLDIGDSAARRRIRYGLAFFLAPVVIGVAIVLHNRMM
jgi:hypothetical protein